MGGNGVSIRDDEGREDGLKDDANRCVFGLDVDFEIEFGMDIGNETLNKSPDEVELLRLLAGLGIEVVCPFRRVDFFDFLIFLFFY